MTQKMFIKTSRDNPTQIIINGYLNMPKGTNSANSNLSEVHPTNSLALGFRFTMGSNLET